MAQSNAKSTALNDEDVRVLHALPGRPRVHAETAGR
jgi:hypothetical protein